MTNIAMENGSFIDALPFLKMVDLSMAMLNSQRVYILIYIYIMKNDWRALETVSFFTASDRLGDAVFGSRPTRMSISLFR
jgi:hypothetical protein